MRNGNSNPPYGPVKEIHSSYPTYEEWKQLEFITVKPVLVCSYPTYEEWKLKPVIPCLL